MKFCAFVRLATFLSSSSLLSAADSDAPAAPLRIDGPEQSQLDMAQPDGGLLPVPGVQSYAVFRASRVRPDLADGKGYTYNHHGDLAVWRGRFYVGWASGQKDEDLWPGRELYSTSTDGRTWSAPAELFPQGTSTPLRFYFFHAKKSGRMLALAGLRLDHEKTIELRKGPAVLREIRADHTLGPVYTFRPPLTGPRDTDPPPFERATDAGFIAACRELQASRVALETQDFGLLLDPTQRISWHDPKQWPTGEIGGNFWKATTFFHRRDGAIVGIGKNGWTSVSADEGATWSLPMRPPTLVTGGAKVWGQRTGDGRYALVYNPHGRLRFPLVMVTSDDGVVFSGMRAVQDHFPAQRYMGINKNFGLQYTRGIAEWASDGSVADAQRALWLVYSANKEDIWVSRVPFAKDAPKINWDVYQPKWARVSAERANALELESREPHDFARASRAFPAAKKVTVTLEITPSQPANGALDIDLLGGPRHTRAVRVRLGNNQLHPRTSGTTLDIASLKPGEKHKLTIIADCAEQSYTVIRGEHKMTGSFTEEADTIERLSLRLWANPAADRPNPLALPTKDIEPEFDQPSANAVFRITQVKIEPRE